MRTGGEYREALRDGRRVWVMGEGWAGDVTAHPATRAMVEEYAAWYDRHLDLAWQEVLLARADADGERVPWAYVAPKGAEDLIGMGRSLLGAHTPASKIFRISSFGTGSGFSRRIDRVVRMISNRSVVSEAASGVARSVMSALR